MIVLYVFLFAVILISDSLLFCFDMFASCEGVGLFVIPFITVDLTD